MKRKFAALLLAGAMALSLAACGNEAGPAAEDAPPAETGTPASTEDGVVQTMAGLIQGTDENGIYRYLGIPYAQATERFVPAEDVEPWEGILVADTYGNMSP